MNIINNNNNNNNSSSIDYVDSSISGTGTLTRTGSASTTSCSSSMYATFSTPLGGSTAQIHETTSYINDEVEGGNINIQEPLPLPKITLPNHGKGSAFVAYAQLKCYNKKNILVQPIVKQSTMFEVRPTNENLLTSEYTHFQPIRTYRDGHVFNICSAWDVIDYERSASGTLCLGNDKYMEYKAHENNNAEDDILPAAASALYASSNCEAAKHMRNQKKKPPMTTEFILKFKVRKGCEVACQTEDPNRLAHLNTLKLPEQHPLCLLFAGGAKVNRRNLQNAGAACSDALDALNRAIAAAAKTKTARKTIIKSSNDLMWPTSENSNNNNDNWSMHAISKKCQLEQQQQQQQMQQQQHNLNINNNNNETKNKNNNNNNSNSSNNNNNLNENSCDITDKHTLWGLCAECHNEDKSLPADCMLRAELNEEADEIMSDLKHMQDLYIHRVADTDTTDEDDDDNEKDKDKEKLLLYGHSQQQTINMNADDWRADVCAPTTPFKAAVVVQQMNRFIEDWLRPPLKPVEPATNIWYDKTVRNIWQPTTTTTAAAATSPLAASTTTEINWQPLEFLRQLHVVDNTNVNNDEQNTWEHVNLAAIWQKDTPTTTVTNTTTTTNTNITTTINTATQNSVENMIDEKHNVGDYDDDDGDDDDDVIMNCHEIETEHEKIMAKNYKNLHNENFSKKSKKSQRVLDFLQNYNNINFFKNNNNQNITTTMTTDDDDDNIITTVTPKIIANRKRRHSASQNYFDQQQQQQEQHQSQQHQQEQLLLTLNHNNDNIVLSTFHKMLLQRECFNNNNNNNNNNNHNENFKQNILFLNNNNNCHTTTTTTTIDNQQQQQPQTVITCKYWTTAATTAATSAQNYNIVDDDDIGDNDNDIIDNNVFSCHFDKNNASILHHVTTAMVARPLTR